MVWQTKVITVNNKTSPKYPTGNIITPKNGNMTEYVPVRSSSGFHALLLFLAIQSVWQTKSPIQ